MSEQELLEKIRQSAEFVEVPESLSPEKILEKCRTLEQEKEEPEKNGTPEREKTERSEEEGQKRAGKKFRRIHPGLLAGLSAAAVFTICFISLRETGGIKLEMTANDAAMPAESGAQSQSAECVEEGIEESVMLEADAGSGAEEKIQRRDAGNLYTLAESYDTVYERLEEIKKAQDKERAWTIGGNMTADIGAAVAETEDTAASGTMENLQQSIEKASAADKEKYSETNVQTAGIDESDIVKTDGAYIYLLRGSSVSILSAGEGEMKQVGALEADAESGSADICAMYVDGAQLILMMQESKSTLEEEESGDEAYYDYDLKYIDTDVVTSVLTYDISDRTKPVLAGKVEQDGAYVTSRKDGGMVYLFTEKYLMEDYGKGPEAVIPAVNARKIAEDCIYIGDRGERALVISSLSAYQPEAVIDSVMILDSGSEIYMGGDSLYLYRGNYQSAGETTEIAKFSLTGGYLNGVAAVSVRGTVRDTFAIHEKNKKLRVLTTDMSGNEWENCLFLLDENLKVTGKLMHIAAGESIYAARYLGDMAYFITYRNTDPLFAVDLSDEKNPRLLGELEITGFSEYLHFWEEDKLLGLGYETDPKTGEQKGLKLVMFDMSDPAELKVLGSKVLEKTSYSPALYDYKAVLADPQENLIGFVTEYYKNGVRRTYELYQWNGERFEKLLSEELQDGFETENYRGLYIGERFYIAHPEVVRLYDRADYSLRQKLEIK